MLQACKEEPSRTFLQSVQTNIYSNPLCGRPFDLDGRTGLELLCADGTGERASQVTAISTNGERTHNCTHLPLNIYSTYCGNTVSIMQRFACQ